MAEEPSIPLRTTGFRLLHRLSLRLNVPLDQVNFAACQLLALLAAFWFRHYLSPTKVSTVIRHVVVTILGIYFVIFCFGWYSLHVFIEIFLCYCIMTLAKIKNIHKYSFVAALAYLTLCQISRVYIFSYKLLSTDFSGPLMIITQKITSLAFQLHDGMGRKEEDLTKEQSRVAVRVRPTFLQYCSYHLNFLSILAGPTSNYKDYIAFIEGSHINMKLLEINWKKKGYRTLPDPSPLRAVVQKVAITVVCALLFLSISKKFPISYVSDENFVREASFFSRISYLIISINAVRPKYYFAWTLADAINNAAGYGFNGIDENGNFRWDLISNLNIWNIETATSFKMCLDNWNIQTLFWLKSICYDRLSNYRIPLTLMLSAVWHGVYPGYYFTFITAIPVTMAARTVRRNFRHYFLSSKTKKVAYDIATWATTQLVISYTAAPFLLLAVGPTIRFYKSMYFYGHIVCLLVLLVLPTKLRYHFDQKTERQPDIKPANETLDPQLDEKIK
ncbi:lysophospholipid acyltransferase 1 isoform X2 [Callorhinchus milii]|uniref:lysophospholipid acyltransferase 1 isoform X2 n=1 Tax=Callorhinchus milii TaxID=7868 RepID=UPI001C3F8437|nr:lysophospholipid acyltransferase 1 isoform X2 [Callorhinchus milii]